MKITKRQLKSLIREAVLQEATAGSPKTILVTHGDYGYMGIKDDLGNEYAMGEIIAELLDDGATEEIFTPAGQQGGALQRIQKSREEKVQGGIERWDSDVFEQYYDIDRDRAVEVWATMKGAKVEEVKINWHKRRR